MIEAASRFAVWDEHGLLEFESVPADSREHPSALWITHESHRPHLEALPPGATSLPSLLELEPAPTLRVRVVDEGGETVEAAQVFQLAPIPANAVADLVEPQALRVLQRRVSTGPDGWARMPAWTDELLLWAELGERVSAPWIGSHRSIVELELRSTFAAAGRVDYSAGDELHGPQRVLCLALWGTQEVVQAAVDVVDGSFGPVTLALSGADRYGFRLEGFNALVETQYVDPPDPGDEVFLEFEARAGLDVWTRITDEAGQLVPGAESVVRWEVDGERVELVSHTVVEDGYYPNRGVPAGALTLLGRAPGHVPVSIGPIEVDPTTSYPMVLRRGRAVPGRVTRGGAPVEDFDVTWWAIDPRSRQTESFRSRERGDFTIVCGIDDLVRVVATAPGFGPSETVLRPPANNTPVELELTDLLRGSGAVVDAATGEPLRGVLVQAYVTEASRSVVPIGAPVRTRSDGSFDATVFAPGLSRTRFVKPGYSEAWLETLGQPGEEIEFGSIAMSSRQPLTIRLIGGGGVDLSLYRLRSTGIELAERQVPEDGVLRFAEASAGVYHLQVGIPGGPRILHTAMLDPGEDWMVEIPVGSSRTLRARFDTGDLSVEGLYAAALLPQPDGRPIEVIEALPASRVVEFPVHASGYYDLSLQTRDETTIGSTNGQIPGTDPIPEALVTLHSRAQAFRVIGENGEPVPGGDLFVLNPKTLAGGGCRLDQQGRGTVSGLEPGDYLARVVHPELGFHFNIPVLIAPRNGDELELQFFPSRSVEVLLRDGSEPLVGVQCWLFEKHGTYGLAPRTSASDGRIAWEHLGPGPYELRADHPEVWSTEVPIEARGPGDTQVVQLRRKGNVVIELDNVQGQPLANQAFELVSSQFQTSVEAWIEAGRVQSSTGTLRTDSLGEVELFGLPRGAYGWSARGTAGDMVVAPSATTRERLSVP